MCGGGEAHRPAGLRASLDGLAASGHFLSSPAPAGLASLGGGGCCDVGESFIRWQISAYEGFLSSWEVNNNNNNNRHQIFYRLPSEVRSSFLERD